MGGVGSGRKKEFSNTERHVMNMLKKSNQKVRSNFNKLYSYSNRRKFEMSFMKREKLNYT